MYAGPPRLLIRRQRESCPRPSSRWNPDTQLAVYRDPTGRVIQAGPPKHGTSRAQFKSLPTGGGDGSRPSSPDDTKIVEYVPD
ncbi:putative ATP-grasp-modified RiPP [Kribbella sp. NPDC023855]|uniref:putative ATP-grasp-modified RiPP n=1 Tax=Kribbella sp. NPDC023855 TaxID=3154698 RepID=UPI0033C001D2